ncbi:UNVERIFIED_CONTAM: hypothetical protein FKN15_061483 [Acipenser sinensis]
MWKKTLYANMCLDGTVSVSLQFLENRSRNAPFSNDVLLPPLLRVEKPRLSTTLFGSPPFSSR